MQLEANPYEFLRFSTGDLPFAERLPYWREVFARQICHVDIEPKPDCPLEADATMFAIPGLGGGWCRSASPASWKRTSAEVKDGLSDFALLVPLAGAMVRTQLGHDLETRPGAAVGVLHNEPATIRFDSLEHIAVMVPREAISPLVGDLEQASTRLVPNGTGAVRLLTGYVKELFKGGILTDPALSKLATTHVYDLVALALGATRDARDIVLNRGVRAARLKAIKTDLARNPALTLAAIAARQRVTPRYVQLLFEEDGTTFSEYALRQRLDCAHRLLTDPGHRDWSISAIALEAGFGDLSHFNRAFRRRYGAAPSEVRSEALRAQR